MVSLVRSLSLIIRAGMAVVGTTVTMASEAGDKNTGNGDNGDGNRGKHRRILVFLPIYDGIRESIFILLILKSLPMMMQPRVSD